MNLKLAARNIFRNATRSFISLLVMSSGVVAMILGAGFIEDTMRQIRESSIRDFLGHIRIYKKGFLEQGLLHPSDYLIDHPAELAQTLRSQPHVRSAGPRLLVSGLISTGETTLPFAMQAFEPEFETSLNSRSQLVDGELLEPGKNFDVLVGTGLARTLNAKIGDTLVLLANTQRGAINAMDVNVRGIFLTGAKDLDDRTIRAPLLAAQKLLRSDGVQMILVFLDNSKNVERVAHDLVPLLNKAGTVYEVKPWYDLPESAGIKSTENVYRAIFRVAKVIIFLVVVLGIMNTMNMSVLERIGEIGTLLALGTKQSGILALFLWEGALLGLMGALLGCLIGYALAGLISWIGMTMPTAPGQTEIWIAKIAISWRVMVPAFLMAVITSVLSSVLPAIKASRLEVGEALRHNI